MFENRGYAPDFFDKICVCDHSIPKDIDKMCEHLKRYHDSNDQILLLTDFDMDGIMCGVIGFAGLAELGFNVSLAMPRISDGYGFTAEFIDTLHAQYPDAKALMTADVGVTAFEGIARARELGLEVFVTDHHKPDAVRIVDANVVVDPSRDDDTEAFWGICGAHVLYLVLRYYAENCSDKSALMVPQIERLRVFAGFGTVSDSMPVYYENRPLVRDAVSICRFIYGDGDEEAVSYISGCDVYRRAFRGLYLLLKGFAEIKNTNINQLDEDFFGFYLAPVFNSIRRMNGDILSAYNIFFGSREEAENCIQYVIDINEKRKAYTQDCFDRMKSSRQPWAPYVWITDALPGICGLLAQRMMNETGLPTLVLVEDGEGYHGSGRCPVWYSFLKYARNAGPWVAAGHESAFGVGFADASCIDAYVTFISNDILVHKPDDSFLEFKPDFVISTLGDGDTDIDIGLFDDFLYELGKYRPFGQGFEKPTIMLRFRPRDGVWYTFGSENTHVKVILPKGLNLLCFNQANMFGEQINRDTMPPVIEVIGTLEENNYNGNHSVQFLGPLPMSVAQNGVNDRGKA